VRATSAPWAVQSSWRLCTSLLWGSSSVLVGNGFGNASELSTRANVVVLAQPCSDLVYLLFHCLMYRINLSFELIQRRQRTSLWASTVRPV